MDGREISVIKFSELNSEFRIDSVYYQKKYLKDEIYLAQLGAKPIKCFVADGQHGYHELDEHSPIHMLTAKNAKNWFADLNGAARVSKWVDDENKRSSLRENDLVLSTRGTVGYCALVKPVILPANLDQDLARIKILDKAYRAEYVLTYLKSKFGQDWMKRNQTGMVQQGLPLQKVRKFPIPYLSESFQDKIVELINYAYSLLRLSEQHYASANQIVNSNLNIRIPDHDSRSVKTFSDSYLQCGRLDAEYYQPKYDALFALLGTVPTAPLGGRNGLVSIKKSIEPGRSAYREEGIPFVRVSDVNKFELTDPEIRISPDLVPDIKSLYPRKDTILLSKDGSVGIAYQLREDRQIVTSGALLHLTVKDTTQILPEYLTLVLNSPIVQLQAERDCNGAIIQHWALSDITKVVIPLLKMEQQREIAEKVRESFRLRTAANLLLDQTILAVELAIETDETSALESLKNAI